MGSTLTRRHFLALAGSACAELARPGFGWARVTQGPLALLLRGGRFYRGGLWQTGDIGIDEGGRLRFGSGLAFRASLDVTGKIVAPGFIDVLADNSVRPEVTFPVFEKYKVSDGVTTALQMHGGSADCGAYYKRFGGYPHVINYGVSTFVMAIRYRTQSRSERLRLVERNLAEGALGVSHSLEYQPAPYEELLDYAKLAARYDRPVVLHLRYSSEDEELLGVQEGLRLARESGARLHIAHLHSTGGSFHMEAALSLIRAAIAAGSVITACVYPYSYWATYLSSRRFDPGWRERYHLDFGDLQVLGSKERLTAASFERHRLRKTLVAVPEGTLPLARTVDLALREDFCMIGSDGGIQREPRSNSHPRGAACFSTALRYALDRKLPLERMLAKMTELPRSLVRPALRERGVLEEGAVADLTVLDPATVRGNATIENPNQLASGIELVLVNGKRAYQDHQLVVRGGQPIRC